MDHFLGVALLNRVSGPTLLRNVKKLDKFLQVTSMPGYFKLLRRKKVGIIKEERTCMVEVTRRIKMGELY